MNWKNFAWKKMRSHLDRQDKYGELRLFFNHPSNQGKKAVLVEGDSDKKCYPAWLRSCSLLFEEVPGSRNDVIELVRIFARPFEIAGVCDLDFDAILPPSNDVPPSIFFTDWHDAEMSIWMNERCRQRILCEVLSGNLIKEDNFVETVHSLAVRLGALRLVNQRENLEINFKGIKLGEIANGNLSIYEENLLSTLNSRSPNKKRPLVKEDLRVVLNENLPLGHLCQGHDIIMASSYYFRSQGVHESLNHLGAIFRMSLTEEMFLETRLGADLKKWALQEAA